jgi:imidazolonepropionase
MSKRILVRGARQLLTLRGPSGPRRGSALRDLGIISDGALLIVDGAIAEIGPTRRVENLAGARDAMEIDATGRVVMPGFVDSHTHLVWGQPRLLDFEMRCAGASTAEIAAAGGGILSSVAAVRSLPARRLELQTRRALEAFVRHGTTTVEAKSGYGLDESAELKTLRVLNALDRQPVEVIPTYLGAQAIPPEYEGRADEYVDWMCTYMIPKIRQRKLASFVDVSCDPAAFTWDQSLRYLRAARQHGLQPKIHAEEFSHTGGVRLAVQVDAASADHLAEADEEDAALLARSATIATMLPGPSHFLGLPSYPPARMLIDHGAAVALATDYNPHTSPTCNMQMILSLACSRMRMSPAEALSAATINGAHALGCASRIGSLEYRKDADLIMLNVSDYREIPYYFGVNIVAITMKKGEIIFRQPDASPPPE